jgi:hypothetical protein
MLSDIVLHVIMLSDIVLHVIMLNVIMLSVMVPSNILKQGAYQKDRATLKCSIHSQILAWAKILQRTSALAYFVQPRVVKLVTFNLDEDLMNLFGATTLSIMTLGIMTLSAKGLICATQCI